MHGYNLFCTQLEKLRFLRQGCSHQKQSVYWISFESIQILILAIKILLQKKCLPFTLGLGASSFASDIFILRCI